MVDLNYRLSSLIPISGECAQNDFPDSTVFLFSALHESAQQILGIPEIAATSRSAYTQKWYIFPSGDQLTASCLNSLRWARPQGWPLDCKKLQH